MARRETRHASRSYPHASAWAETPARPSSSPEPPRGHRAEEPQWPEGSWWAEQSGWTENGQRSPRPKPRRRREPSSGAGRRRSQPRPQARRRSSARSAGRPPGPRARPRTHPRGGRRPTDRLSVGAIALSCVVGLALLGIAERALLEGGTIGASGPVGAEQPAKNRKERTTPGRRDAPRQQPGPSGAPGRAPAGPDVPALSAQVRKLTLAERGAAARQTYGAAPTRPPMVEVARTSPDKTWAFGTTAIPVPDTSGANPEVAFFAARWRQDRWQVALSGGDRFAGLLSGLPATVMSADEGRALRRYGALTAAQATAQAHSGKKGDALMLPWKSGTTWSMGTGDGGTSVRPLGSLAFWGGDGRVLSSGAGRLYRFCGDQDGRALVMVIHGSGLATTYYRVRSVPELRDGSIVQRGDPLGRTGSDRPCGGAPAARPEVEFDLRRGAERVPLDGALLGGWTFRERAKPLLGYAERGELQVLPGGQLANLGPVPGADVPPSPPDPGPEPGDGDDPGGATARPALQKRSLSGANTQQ
ncbi:peptidoglycan DD-metalloendopeptidase family protein [Actinomadura macra]|uniref:peptidoglycan DD-metalloendopeptidase family protein n=1 Tax=Actinomadura macra TaxID=46164 RepID=UPI0008359989|nr:peptidoglycan DD-metalloendopeptidase family protein [Actinomadura macra]